MRKGKLKYTDGHIAIETRDPVVPEARYSMGAGINSQVFRHRVLENYWEDHDTLVRPVPRPEGSVHVNKNKGNRISGPIRYRVPLTIWP